MMGAESSSSSCWCGGTLGAYASLVAGDPDYKLTWYGVSKTEAAVAREEREQEEKLRQQVALREEKCAKMEAEIAKARAIAMQCDHEARNAPGGIQGAAAQIELSRARTAMLQMARLNTALRQMYTKVEFGRRALEALHARASLSADREYLDSIRNAVNSAELPEEQFTYVQNAGEDAVDQFVVLDEQNEQYNELVQNMDQSLVQSTSTNAAAMFGDYDLNDSASLLDALASMRGTSHEATVLTTTAVDAAPPPPATRMQYASYANLVQPQQTTSSSTAQQQQTLSSRSTHSQSKLPRPPLDARVAAEMF